ncbi:MAG: GNAT family N-acetyltransferase [Erythrobacter sp.]|jgi:ribosomal-protein-alanine N-acetyltransferase|nr:GNAT family N-acetyltransferase [Erythrobacter sp.]
MNPCPTLVDQIMVVIDSAFDPHFGEAWTRRQIADALVLPSTHALLIDGAGEVIAHPSRALRCAEPAGFVLTRQALDEEELLLIAIAPPFRRRGLGAALIDRLFDAARARGTCRIVLEMRRENPAVHLYKKLGFEPIGERREYYRLADGSRADAITFSRSI